VEEPIMTAHPSPAHEAAGDEKLLVHNWRVARLTGLGIPGPLAEVNADHLDWHQVARLVQLACPRGWPCASPADGRARKLARRRLPPRRPGSLPGSTRKGCSRSMLRASPHGYQRPLGKKESA
jgi:hypothetical protein